MTWTCGTDEAGLGSWAGPMMVAGVWAPSDWVPPLGLTDSKKLSPAQREALWDALHRDTRIRFHILTVGSQEIDAKGVYCCLREAHQAIHDILSEGRTDGRQIADGTLTLSGMIESIPKADAKFPVVSAASILAKVCHDREMGRLAVLYPDYGFSRHQGYGTKAHEEALHRFGPSPVHRRSYEPVSRAMAQSSPTGDLLDQLGSLPEDD